jgi:predicted metal-dependent phosphotriesterase family hydrolase
VNEMQVVTVLGPVRPDELGITLSHDHLLSDGWTMTHDYGTIVDDEQLAGEELQLYADAGGGTICDPTCVGLRRDPEALQRISTRTGVKVVMGSGWYREAVYPAELAELSVRALAAQLVVELTTGVGDTGIRAGFIGEIGTERGAISPAQERVFRAAARAHLVTGCPILTHTTHFGELALEQLELLREEGVDPSTVIVSHLGDRYRDNVVPTVARAGAWLSIDNLGFVAGYAPLEVRADNVLQLWKDGFGERILLSNDICNVDQLTRYGGPGYANVIESFVPLLRERGLGDGEIDQMLRVNPAAAFAYPADEAVRHVAAVGVEQAVALVSTPRNQFS